MNSPNKILLNKAKRVIGKTLVFRNVTTSDADFILSLRTDKSKGKYLSSTSTELKEQINWLKSYENKIDQAYFIIESISGDPLGTVRLYDSQGSSFCWGSWILKDGAPKISAIESTLMVYAYALDHLGFRESHFDVRKENEKVWRFHERFGAERIGENEQDYFYRITPDKIKIARQRYNKFLFNQLHVES